MNIIIFFLAFQFSFSQAEPIQIQSTPVQCEAFDFNNDQTDEIAVLSQDGTFEIIQYNPKTLRDETVFRTKTSGGPAKEFALMDVDNDGNEDVVIVGNTTLVLYRIPVDHSTRAFFRESVLGFVEPSLHVGFGLLNDDEYPDLVINTYGHHIKILINENGKFTNETSIGTIGFASRCKILDADGDEKNDIVVSSVWNPTGGIHVYYNRGLTRVASGAWVWESQIHGWYRPGERILTFDNSDFDGDGIQDFVVGFGARRVSNTTFFGVQGGGLVQQYGNNDLNYVTRHLVVGGLNDDGLLDYAYTALELDYGFSNQVFIVSGSDSDPSRFDYNSFNLSGSRYTIGPSFPRPIFSSISTADLNGDGLTDLIMSDQRENKIYILLNGDQPLP